MRNSEDLTFTMKQVLVLAQFCVKVLLLFTLLAMVVTACSRHSYNHTKQPTPEPSPVSCQAIQYVLEAACIPVNPHRLAVLDYHQLLPTFLALGIKPVGAMTLQNVDRDAPFLEGMTSGIESLGYFSQQPNLEKILALHPDLILGWDFFIPSKKLLSQIAPTVLFSFTESTSNWKQFLRIIATEFNKLEVADKLLNDYESRVESLHEILANQPQKLSASCISIHNGAIYLVANETPVQSVFKDIGLQQSSLEDAVEDSYFAISQEKLSDIDADIVFIAASGEKDRDFARKFQDKPLWKKLKAVHLHRVYQVDADTWTSFNILSINAILDDLEKYLIHENN